MANNNGNNSSNGANGRNGVNGSNGKHSDHPAEAYEDLLLDLPIGFGLGADIDAPEQYEQTEIVDGSPEQQAKVAQAIRDLLDAFNVNWDDPNYTDTPQRVAKAYIEHWVSGYGRDPQDEVTVFPNQTGADDLVMVKDMRFHSLCSHHLAPIEGYAAIAYIPENRLLGLSKLGRILDIYARRFQLQERIGQQTADALMELLQPKGVMVVLYNVTHGCMSSRGVKLHEANTTTSAIRGVFKANMALRSEVLSLLSLKSPTTP
ncbi:MAG: GTP cyclohydrolase I FolE [Anaerolineaceae bacterium]|nr:MAG: GTP cyclohydrolase I FolE [Anaerolineaceae bacterium]